MLTDLEATMPRSVEVTPAMMKAGASVIEWDEGRDPEALALHVYVAMRRALWKKPSILDDD